MEALDKTGEIMEVDESRKMEETNELEKTGEIGIDEPKLPLEIEEELCSLFHCTSKSLSAIMSTVNENPKELLTLLKSLSPKFLAVKVRFDSRKRGDVGGAFCLLCEGTSGDIFDESYWVSSKGFPERFSVNASWESVRKALIDLRGPDLRAHFEKVLWNKLRSIVRDLMTPTQLNLIFSQDKGEKQIEDVLHEQLKEAFRTEIEMQISVERFNKARLELSGLGQEEKKEEKEEKTTTNVIGEGGIQISCNPFVDPVRGKAASELVENDCIWVSFEDTGLSGFIKRTLEQTSEKPVFPVRSVEKLPTGLVLAKIAISEGVQGLVRVSGDIKVRVESEHSMEKISPFPLRLLVWIGGSLLLLWLVYIFLR
ncbi:MAG: hypothetical protein WCQ97_04850 [Aminobacterium sp.]|nr:MULTISPECIES: hypothetical protein [unclassified Aminobacterium]MDD2207092.1 hypothetical protein [Aminobacterium sp.]MDD3426249.1 hypothetical protein [Aminobacterium sp.]MDD3707453.1 hypothetical protein [Aminobacterium sp.]MDD4228795.1 hypothetical protein [Aminobacterium sp.]MDD4550586.1 hypothetical protein [Aminobacterium sp.]